MIIKFPIIIDTNNETEILDSLREKFKKNYPTLVLQTNFKD